MAHLPVSSLLARHLQSEAVPLVLRVFHCRLPRTAAAQSVLQASHFLPQSMVLHPQYARSQSSQAASQEAKGPLPSSHSSRPAEAHIQLARAAAERSPTHAPRSSVGTTTPTRVCRRAWVPAIRSPPRPRARASSPAARRPQRMQRRPCLFMSSIPFRPLRARTRALVWAHTRTALPVYRCPRLYPAQSRALWWVLLSTEQDERLAVLSLEVCVPRRRVEDRSRRSWVAGTSSPLRPRPWCSLSLIRSYRSPYRSRHPLLHLLCLRK